MTSNKLGQGLIDSMFRLLQMLHRAGATDDLKSVAQKVASDLPIAAQAIELGNSYERQLLEKTHEAQELEAENRELKQLLQIQKVSWRRDICLLLFFYNTTAAEIIMKSFIFQNTPGDTWDKFWSFLMIFPVIALISLKLHLWTIWPEGASALLARSDKWLKRIMLFPKTT